MVGRCNGEERETCTINCICIMYEREHAIGKATDLVNMKVSDQAGPISFSSTSVA